MVPAPTDTLVAVMSNDIGDRHVLATAVTVGAEVILTENLRHFTPPACAPHGIIAMTLDDFISRTPQDLAPLHSRHHRTISVLAHQRAHLATRSTTTNTSVDRSRVPQACHAQREPADNWGHRRSVRKQRLP